MYINTHPGAGYFDIFILLEGRKLENPTVKQAREDGTVGEAIGTEQ